MRNHRFVEVAISEDEDDVPLASCRSVGGQNQRKRKRLYLDNDDFEVEKEKPKETKKKEEILEPEDKSENEEVTALGFQGDEKGRGIIISRYAVFSFAF